MIRRTSMSLLSLCFLFGCTTTGSSEEGLSSRIRSYQSQIIEDEVTGSNLVIVGAADGTRAMSVVNSGRPGDRDVDESTVFPVWSMSKPITIVAMMMLHEQGKFEMDDHVSEYLPCFESSLFKMVIQQVPPPNHSPSSTSCLIVQDGVTTPAGKTECPTRTPSSIQFPRGMTALIQIKPDSMIFSLIARLLQGTSGI